MTDYEIHQKFGEYNIGVIFIYDEYTKKDLVNDYQDIIDYQNKSGFSDDTDERNRELDLKFYKQFDRKKLPEITYDFFKDKSFEVFSKFFLFFMKDNLNLTTSKEFNIQFKVRRIPDRDYYFEYGGEDVPSDPENACFLMSGSWLIHSIVLPSLFGTSNFSLIQRYMLHELTHHYDKMKKYDYWQSKYEAKFKKFYIKKSAFFLNCLYTSLFNLREEGLPDFIARKESPMIDFKMDGVRKYNANMIKLSTLTKKSESEPFYENEIGWGNLTPSNEYTMGRNMSLTIALALCKKMNKPFSIVINNERLSSKGIYLNNLLSKDRPIYFTDIDKEVFEATIEKVRPLAHYKFLQAYETACSELGIKEENMIMTRRRFYGIVSDSITRMKKEKIARLKLGGFRYAEKDISTM